MTQKTYIAKAENVERKCYLVDAKDKVVGRVATKVATILRGKHKAIYTPHVDTGDQVIIINADKVRVTGKKMRDKHYQYYTGFHGGRKIVRFEELIQTRPTQVLRLAITRMIPSGPLGNKVKTKLKIYAGDKHPHQAQQPIPLAI
ncbi:MAG: 50S ribosomal protein L13 [Candidatus Omnitrophica bacterium]|nr:50S ribosomal protein L13 [Candidatus Omnitrophota bacterium]